MQHSTCNDMVAASN